MAYYFMQNYVLYKLSSKTCRYFSRQFEDVNCWVTVYRRRTPVLDRCAMTSWPTTLRRFVRRR